MADLKFVEGVKCDLKEFDNGGKIIKVSVYKPLFEKNVFNDKGYLNIDIKFSSKNGKPYAVINEYKKVNTETVKEEFNGTELLDDELLF